MQESGVGSRWYHQPWMWLVVGLLGTSVLASLTMVAISVVNRDELVRDDWYKAGRAINQDLSAARRAEELGLSATLNLDPARLQVTLVISSGTSLPDRLKLVMTHSTLSHEDMTTIVTRGADSTWLGTLPRLPLGKRHISLEPVTMDGEQTRWRLRANDAFFQGSPLTLTP